LEAQLGVGWEASISRHFGVQIAPRLGARAHHYDADTFLQEPTGTRFDLLATLATAAIWRLGSEVSLGLDLVAGVTSASYQHQIDGVAVWSRGPGRLEAGVHVEWRP